MARFGRSFPIPRRRQPRVLAAPATQLAANLTGTGSLTAAATTIKNLPAALTGTGTLSATLRVGPALAAGLSGTGSLTAAMTVTHVGDYPTITIEWLPTQGPAASDGDWCDITSYVSDFAANPCGRQYELDRFQAGSLTLTLKTPTRLFDPEYTTGPFYPWLVSMRQIRMTATWNSVVYPVFRGYITTWGETVPDDVLFVTTVTAADAFTVLEQIALPSSAWALEVQRDNPTLWFRLGETGTVRASDASPNGNYGLYDNVTQGTASLVPHDSNGAVTVGHSDDDKIIIQNPALITGYPFTISAMIETSVNRAEYKIILGSLLSPNSATSQIMFAVLGASATAADGTLEVRVVNGGTSRIMRGSTLVDDGQPHQVVWVATSSSSFALYVDGVAETLTTVASGSPTWPGPFPSGYALGNLTDNAFGDYGLHGVLDEVCVWDGVILSDTRIAAHALAAVHGWDADDTGTRVGRLLDAIGWPANLRDIQTGISTLGPATFSGSALNAIQGWADTEFGLFYISTAGKIVWRSRHSPLLDTNAVTSQGTFGDGHSSATLKYDNNGFEFPRDETLIRNPVTAARNGGVTVTVRDGALIDGKYGPRNWTAPVSEDRLDASVRDRAEWLLRRYKERTSRLAKMQITPRRDPTNLWPQVLGRVVGDRITVKRTPLGIGNELVSDQIIEGVSHQGSPQVWTTTFRGAPADTNIGLYLILDDATYGLLDTGALAY